MKRKRRISAPYWLKLVNTSFSLSLSLIILPCTDALLSLLFSERRRLYWIHSVITIPICPCTKCSIFTSASILRGCYEKSQARGKVWKFNCFWKWRYFISSLNIGLKFKSDADQQTQTPDQQSYFIEIQHLCCVWWVCCSFLVWCNIAF